MRRTFREMVKFTEDHASGQDPEYGHGERDAPASRLRNLAMGLRGSIGRGWQHAEGFAENLEDIANQIDGGTTSPRPGL